VFGFRYFGLGYKANRSERRNKFKKKIKRPQILRITQAQDWNGTEKEANSSQKILTKKQDIHHLKVYNGKCTLMPTQLPHRRFTLPTLAISKRYNITSEKLPGKHQIKGQARPHCLLPHNPHPHPSGQAQAQGQYRQHGLLPHKLPKLKGKGQSRRHCLLPHKVLPDKEALFEKKPPPDKHRASSLEQRAHPHMIQLQVFLAHKTFCWPLSMLDPLEPPSKFINSHKYTNLVIRSGGLTTTTIGNPFRLQKYTLYKKFQIAQYKILFLNSQLLY